MVLLLVDSVSDQVSVIDSRISGHAWLSFGHMRRTCARGRHKFGRSEISFQLCRFHIVMGLVVQAVRDVDTGRE